MEEKENLHFILGATRHKEDLGKGRYRSETNSQSFRQQAKD